MRAIVLPTDKWISPDGEAKTLPRRHIHVKPGESYLIYALAIFDEIPHYLVVEKHGWTDFYPAYLFELTDSTLGENWRLMFIPEAPRLFIVGPNFLTSCRQDYEDFVEHKPALHDRFFRHADEVIKKSLVSQLEVLQESLKRHDLAHLAHLVDVATAFASTTRSEFLEQVGLALVDVRRASSVLTPDILDQIRSITEEAGEGFYNEDKDDPW